MARRLNVVPVSSVMNPLGACHRAGGTHPVPGTTVVHPRRSFGGGFACEVVPVSGAPLPPSGRRRGARPLEPPGARSDPAIFMPPGRGREVVVGNSGGGEGGDDSGDRTRQPQIQGRCPRRISMNNAVREAVGSEPLGTRLDDHGGAECLHEWREVRARHSMVPGFQQVNVPDDGGDAVLIAAASLEVRSQVRGVTERGHLRGVGDQICVADADFLVVFVRVHGDQLDIHVAQLDVRVVVVDVLNDGCTVRGCGPPRGGHHVVVAPLVVPQTRLVGDPVIGVFGGEDRLGMKRVDDVVCVIDMVGVRVRAQVERQV